MGIAKNQKVYDAHVQLVRPAGHARKLVPDHERQDRPWACAWSPEQIAQRLPIHFPDDSTKRISHEAIDQALFIQGRGALRCGLTACLRSGRALRVPRARSRGRGRASSRPRS